MTVLMTMARVPSDRGVALGLHAAPSPLTSAAAPSEWP